MTSTTDTHDAVAPPAGPLARRRRDSAAAFARRHAVFLGLLALAALVRGAVLLAYHPAIIFFDSVTYLDNVREFLPHKVRPLGYPAFLRGVISIGGLGLVTIVQHAMGLGIGVMLYALVTRLGARPWIAALGAVPVLFDGFQLSLEEHILAETLFEFALVLACVLLLWRRRPTVGLAAGAGLALAVVALTRAVGMAAIGPALLAVLLLAPRRPWPAIALVLAFAVPLVGYAAWYKEVHQEFAVTSFGGRFLYGRVATFADCQRHPVSPDVAVLCPREPLDERMYASQYIWRFRSPLFDVPRRQRTEVAGAFAKQAIRNQPLDYATTVLKDAAKAFGPITGLEHDDAPTYWYFKPAYTYYEPATLSRLQRYGYSHGKVRPDLARVLRGYQDVVHLHGPLLAVLLLVALAGALGIGRARRAGLRTATLLLLSMSVGLFAGAVANGDFTWRYRLPMVVLVPPAAALAVTAFQRRDRGRPARAIR